MSSTDSRRILSICAVSIDTPPLERGDVALQARARAERHDRRGVPLARRTTAAHSSVVARVDDEVRRGGRMPALVGPVAAQLVGAGDDAVGVERRDQVLLQAHRPSPCGGRWRSEFRYPALPGARPVATSKCCSCTPAGRSGPTRTSGVVDPEGRARGGRGRAGVRDPRVHRGDRLSPNAGELTDLGTVRLVAQVVPRRGRSKATSTRARSRRTHFRCNGHPGAGSSRTSGGSTARSGSGLEEPRPGSTRPRRRSWSGCGVISVHDLTAGVKASVTGIPSHEHGCGGQFARRGPAGGTRSASRARRAVLDALSGIAVDKDAIGVVARRR